MLEDERLAGAGFPARNEVAAGVAVAAAVEVAVNHAADIGARVSEAWAEILSGAQSDGGRPEPEHDRRFLSAGGHSLAAARLIARLGADLGVHLPMSAILLADPTLAELIATVATHEGAGDDLRADTRVLTPALPHGAPGSVAGSSQAPTFRSAALSPSLRRLWTWHRLHPESPAYNVIRALDIHGRIKPTALRAAMADVAARHEALRCSIAEPAPGRPEFVLEDVAAVPLVVELLSESGDESGRRGSIDAALQRIAEQPFPMDAAPLWRVGIVYSPSLGHTWLILVMHHLVSDMRAADLVFADLATAYDARTEGREPVFPTAAPSLFAHLEQESRLADSPRWAEHLDWWSRNLAGARAAGPLPLSAPAQQDGTYAGTTYCAEVPAEESAAVEGALSAHALTPAAFFLTAADAVLASWRGRDRTGLIGLPSMRINRPGDENLVGFLLDTLLLPTAAANGERQSFTDAYTAVRNAYADAADHALPAYDEIAARIKAPRAPGNDNPLIGLWFNDLTQASPPARFGGHRVVEHDVPPAWALFDLGLYLRRDAEGRYRVHLVAPRGTMEHADLAALAEQIVRTAVRAAHDPARPVGELLEDDGGDAGTDADSGAGADTGARPAVESTVDLVRRHAAQRPDAVALADEFGTLDYRSLDAQIDELAAAINVRNGRRAVVAVPARRDRSLVLRLLACWRAGATAVLIDAHWPRWRRLLAMQIAGVNREFPWSDREGQALAVFGGAQPAPGTQAADEAAYVLFTSGTTGDPLAVRAVAARADLALADLGDRLAVDAHDRVAMLSGPAHDPVLRDLGLALRAGGTVCIPPEDLFADPAALAGWLRTRRITVVNATPVMLALLCGADPAPLPELRVVVCGGSPLSPATAGLIRSRAPHARIVNGYGCTETPQLVVAHEIGAAGAGTLRAGAQVPIGTPLPGRRVELRTEDGRRCDVGQLGELWIADPHIAEGYLPAHEADGAGAARERTRFVVGADGIRRLRTGDLARRDASGLLHLAGRRDRQMLVNGFRVALEEIESAARRHPAVADAVAHVVGTADGAGQSLRVSVQVTPDAHPSEGELRAHLATVLPPSIVPARILVADRLELSANLKPAAPASEATAPGARTGDPWRGPEESVVDGRLRALAEAMLGGPLDPAVNFFDAGFTSVSLLQLTAELSDLLGRPIEPLTPFTHPNLVALNTFLFGAGLAGTERTAGTARTAVMPPRPVEPAVLAPAQPPSAESEQGVDLRAHRRNLRAWAHASVPARD